MWRVVGVVRGVVVGVHDMVVLAAGQVDTGALAQVPILPVAAAARAAHPAKTK